MSKEKVRVTKDGEVFNLLTEDGREIPDAVPVAPPVGFVRREPLHERIRAMVQHEYQRVRSMHEVETPEEADDFIIPGEEGDDPREARFAMMPGYEWEDNYEPPDSFAEMRKRLIDAGWSPPATKGQEPSSEKPAEKGAATEKALDASASAEKAGPAQKRA